MPLPSIGEFAPTVSTSIFTLLHKYSGNASGDTYEMIQTAFKVRFDILRVLFTGTVNAVL